MKKTLIAIAALVATGAFAQSSVTLSGTVDAGFVTSSVKGVSGAGIVGNLTATSGFGLNASNDLGGGKAAYAKYWTDINPGATYGGSSGTNTLSIGNSENKVGIKGGFGDIAFGAINDIGLESHLAATSFGTAIGSGTSLTSRMNASNKARSDNTIAYNSRSMSGFSLGYVGRKQQVSGSNVVGLAGAASVANQSAVSQVALRYNAGPINVILSRITDDGLNVVTAAPTAAAVAAGQLAAGYANGYGVKDTITNVAGNYNMGAITLYGALQGSRVNNTAGAASDRSAMTFGARYVFGANSINASMGRVTENLSSSAFNGKSSKNLGLGYEYALARTTSFVARYDRVTDDLGGISNAAASIGGTATAGNQDRTRVGVGLRVGF